MRKLGVFAASALIAALGAAGAQQPRPVHPTGPRQGTAERRPSVYYPNCDAARAAGAAPLYRGDPGYRPALDRDGDGVACEPYRGRR